MTPEDLKKTTFTRKTRDAYDRKIHPNGQAFDRLTLTLSAKGWTASVQWDGTTGFRGTGKNIEQAIDASVAGAKEIAYVMVGS